MAKMVPLADDELDNVVGGSHISSGDLKNHIGETLTLTWGIGGNNGGYKCRLDEVDESGPYRYVFLSGDDLNNHAAELKNAGFYQYPSTGQWYGQYDKLDTHYLE